MGTLWPHGRLWSRCNARPSGWSARSRRPEHGRAPKAGYFAPPAALMNASRSVTSFTSITTSDNGRDKHSKGPFVHVIHGPAAPAHKSPKHSPTSSRRRHECDRASSKRTTERRLRCPNRSVQRPWADSCLRGNAGRAGWARQVAPITSGAKMLVSTLPRSRTRLQPSGVLLSL